MTYRGPWRTADIADAILGRSTRPSLPAAALALGLDTGADVSGFELTGIDEVYVVVLPTDDGKRASLAIWPMRLGEPWQQ